MKYVDSRVNVHNLASKSVPFTLTTVQVPNLALTHTKRITVGFLFSVSPSADLLTGSSGYLASEKTANYLHEKVHAVRQTSDNCNYRSKLKSVYRDVGV